MVRTVALAAGLMTALPALAGEITASEARQFVVEKLFSYICFDGTRGVARVHADGSVDGSIQSQSRGLTRYGTMPVNTLRIDGERVCASLPRAAIQPCFYLERATAESFRGSIAGFSFAYCNFTRYQGRTHDIGEQKDTRQLTADR